jgi:hypothetical protein
MYIKEFFYKICYLILHLFLLGCFFYFKEESFYLVKNILKNYYPLRYLFVQFWTIFVVFLFFFKLLFVFITYFYKTEIMTGIFLIIIFLIIILNLISVQFFWNTFITKYNSFELFENTNIISIPTTANTVSIFFENYFIFFCFFYTILLFLIQKKLRANFIFLIYFLNFFLFKKSIIIIFLFAFQIIVFKFFYFFKQYFYQN